MFYLSLLASSMKGLFSISVNIFHSAPSRLDISELCIFGLSWAILRRCPLDQTINAFIGLLIWSLEGEEADTVAILECLLCKDSTAIRFNWTISKKKKRTLGLYGVYKRFASRRLLNNSTTRWIASIIVGLLKLRQANVIYSLRPRCPWLLYLLNIYTRRTHSCTHVCIYT